MKAITRIRIILFALMIFGAFANFALNMWGDSLIVCCEILMALSFFGECIQLVLSQRKLGIKILFSNIVLGVSILLFMSVFLIITSAFIFGGPTKILPTITLFLLLALAALITTNALFDFFGKRPNNFMYECFFLFCVFLGLFFKNLHFPASGLIIVFSIWLLVPYFITTTVKFFRARFMYGKQLVVLLTVGCVATILCGLRAQFKLMHWPWATILFYISSAFIVLMIILALPWKFNYKNSKLNLFEGVRLLDTNVILLFFMLFIYNNYRFLMGEKLVPAFYSNRYPPQVEVMRWQGPSETKKADEIAAAYDNFMQKAEKNGFLK